MTRIGTRIATWIGLTFDAPSDEGRALTAHACEAIGEVLFLEVNDSLPAQLQQQRPDSVLNLARGSDAPARRVHVPAFLEYFNIPYIGSDAVTHATCVERPRMKQACLLCVFALDSGAVFPDTSGDELSPRGAGGSMLQMRKARAELRRVWRRTIRVGLIGWAGAAGCGGARSGQALGGSVSRSDVIDRSEIAKSSAQNAYDAVRALRPAFLVSRGPTSLLRSRDSGTSPVIYLDNSRFGDLSTLRNIPIVGIFEIRYFSATQAQLRWGMDHPSGAILVLTGTPRREPDSE